MKYRKNMKSSLTAISAILVCISMAACMSTVFPEQHDVKSQSPIVEAYVEYTGAPARWAGPASFILHVNAKDAKTAEVSVKHEMLSQQVLEKALNPNSVRAPASVTEVPARSSVEARSSLAKLGEALDGETAESQGCLSPIRVRLIREDGSLLEKGGCRSGLGWPAVASQTVNYFMTAK